MKKLFSIILLISAFISAKGQLYLDTNKYVIFRDGDVWAALFEPQSKIMNLTGGELFQLERLLTEAVEHHNTETKKNIDSVKKTRYYDTLKGFSKFLIDSWKPINLSKYKRQLIIGINYSGNKEVWVNCFKPETYSGKDADAFSFQKKMVAVLIILM